MSTTPARPGSYLWEVPGQPVGIHLSLDVVDRILQEVMRGFAAVPRRGAEVGGIFLGKVSRDEKLAVSIEEFEEIPIEYRRGPSYLLSDTDRQTFEQTFRRLSNAAPKTGLRILGFFRSHTRDAVGLGPEDLELLDKYFPGPDAVVLLIRPFATRVSRAGFYVRQNGAFPSGPPPGEFPFRRKELGGGSRPPRDASRDHAHSPAPTLTAPDPPEPIQFEAPSFTLLGSPRKPLETQKKPRTNNWFWLPLSFACLLLGMLLGYEASSLLHPHGGPGDPFSVSLDVTRQSGNLILRWDRQAPAILEATRGLLTIDEGAVSTPVSLSSEQLRTGSVVYPHKAPEVRFRLELFLGDQATFTEKLDWRE